MTRLDALVMVLAFSAGGTLVVLPLCAAGGIADRLDAWLLARRTPPALPAADMRLASTWAEPIGAVADSCWTDRRTA